MKATTHVLALCLLAAAGCTHREADRPSPLMRAAGSEDVAEVERLLASGADVNEVRGVHAAPGMALHGDNPQHGETALLFAVRSVNVGAARRLLDAGARFDVKDSWGYTVWSVLAERIDAPDGEAMLRLLLSRHPSIPPELAARMLGTAMSRGSEELVLLLLPLAADPALAFCSTGAPLGDAAFLSRMALLENRIGPPAGKALDCGLGLDTPVKLAYFLEHGADPNRLGESFRPLTRLVFEVLKGEGMTDKRREMIRLLLRHGADPGLPDRTHNGSAIEHARRAGHPELLALLTQSPRQ